MVKFDIFKPSNRTGGPRTDVLETITHLPYTATYLSRLTQPLYLLGWSNLDRSGAIKCSPSKNVKDVLFLLSTSNPENCMPDIRRIVEERGKGAPMHSKAKHMLWNVDEEAFVNVQIGRASCRERVLMSV